MTSSSAILYPTLKGLEQSTSSFVQVSPVPARDLKKNLSFNYRSAVLKIGESKSKSKPYECVERKEEIGLNKSQKNDYSGNIDRGYRDKYIGDHQQHVRQSRSCEKTLSAEPKHKVEKSEQCDIREVEVSEVEDIAAVEKEEGLVLSLTKPESFQKILNKYPKPTIIFNNTFINRSASEQDEFLTKFSSNLHYESIGSLSDERLQSVAEHGCKVDNDTSTENRAEGITEPDIQSNPSLVLEKTDCLEGSTSPEESALLCSIITAILWIILILFWFLLYLKVLNLYTPLPKVIPAPTNFEWCLMILRRVGLLISKLWKF